jgi:anti-sigma factor RsiW
MKCHDTSRFMSLFLDSELSSELTLEVQEHLESCPSCRDRFERERRLEESMRMTLLEVGPEDAAIWDRAVRQAVRTRRQRLSTLQRVASLAGVAMFATLLAVHFFPAERGELDLARSAASDHSRFLAEVREEVLPLATLTQFRNAAKQILPPGTNLPTSLPAGYRLLKAGRCKLDDAPVVYLVMKERGEPVSLFLMPSSELHRFPQFGDKLGVEPSGINCRVLGQRFFGTGNREVLACAVGRTDLAELRDLVRWLVAG